MRSTQRVTSFKMTFWRELERIPRNHRIQVIDKLKTLARDPEPDAKVRKRLKGSERGLHRLRSGDYRIFYTYDDTSVSLYSVRRRSKDTYRVMPEAENLDHGRFDRDLLDGSGNGSVRKWELPDFREQVTKLPEPVTRPLLGALGVPPRHHERLLRLESAEALLACPGVSADHLLAIHEHMFERPIPLVATEPTYVAAGGMDDLLRYTEGEFVPFLLKLNPEQERHVAWAPDATGPTLLKGGPGTGKTTVALYRAREMIRILREMGVAEPRILFATFTNALGTFARQLLESLLGEDADLVDVRTVDSLAWQVLDESGTQLRRPEPEEKRKIRRRVERELGSTSLSADATALLRRLGSSFLFTEVEVAIQGRGIRSLAEYLASSRPARRVPLDAASRRVVWAAHEAYERGLAEAGCRTWQQARATAADLVASGKSPVPPYDAVIVDEIQDLGASAIRLLIDLCAEGNRLFATADENQSIHTASFSWTDVLGHPEIGGRVETLTATHRSTEQIIEGARDYLAAGLAGQLAPDAQRYVHSGPLPIVRALSDTEEEADLLARYLPGATRNLHFTVGSSAVLVPHTRDGERITVALQSRGVPAVFQNSRNFEFDDNAVQVLPLHAAKGLEFPVVAVAGFIGSTYPDLPPGVDDDAHIDLLVRERRTIFVAATRAMRSLLVITPKGDDSMLFDGFDPTLWNTG
ncbi:UvrD-helicase domain-containing protein [Candidatus Palauibacter sp.]|uniref:UvrD-helicase domain-containing protein n=1 Tax=Candidatus Palauibacter sp. TaxID=3101350 RepID=UPI003B51746D